MSTTERFEVVVSERGSRVVRKNIEGIGDSGRKAASGVQVLGRALGILGGAAALVQVIRTIDAFTNLQNRLRSTGLEGKQLTGVYQALLKVSNETRSSVEGSVELYSRLALSSKELGVSQKQLIQFTKSLNQAILLSGANANEAQAGLIQLSQGMASGTLRGDELRSVLEQLPAVADVIAKKLGVTRGELRKMGEEGKITAKTIVGAFEASREELEERFGKTVPTISQSFMVLKNNIIDMFGRLDQASGITGVLTKGLMALAQNLDTVVKSVIALVAGFVLLNGSVAIVNAVKTAVLALNVAIRANPLGAFLTVLVSVITALTLFRDQIKLGTDDTTTLGDMMRAAWEGILPVLQTVGDAVGTFFGWITKTGAGTFGELVNQLAGWEHENEATWLKLVRIAVRTFDMIGGVVRGVMVAIGKTIAFVVSESINRFKQLGEVAYKTFTGDFEGAIASAQQAGKDSRAVFSEIGDIWGSTLGDSMKAQVNSGLEAGLDAWIKKSQEIGKARKAAEAAAGGNVGDVAPPAVDLPGTGKKGKKGKDLADELAQVIGQYDRVAGAKMELAQVTNILNAAEAAGLITKDRERELLEMVNYQLRDQLDPLGAVNRELDDQLKLLGMTADAREIQSQLMAIENDLRMQGLKIGETELKQLGEKLKAIQEQNKLDQAKQALRGNTRAGRDEVTQLDISAFKSLIADGDADLLDQFNFLNNMLGGSLDNTQMELDARAAQMEEYFARIRQLRGAEVISAQQASQAIQAIKSAELNANLQRTSDALGAASMLMQSNSKEAFEVGRAAAIGQAIVNTYTAATAAYKSAANIPYVGWILGPVAAAGAIAAGMAQVSAIRSQQMPAYRTGGEYVVGGHGGVDSQTVAMRATPGERISINTPSQAHAMQNVERMMKQERGSGRGNLTQNVTIVQQGRPDRKTPGQAAGALRRQTVRLLEA